MMYTANVPVQVKGSRIERGATVELDPKEAENYGGDLTAVGSVPAVEDAPAQEVPVEEMSIAELKEKAKGLGLKTSGSRADLVERITLAQSSQEEEEEESSQEEEITSEQNT